MLYFYPEAQTPFIFFQNSLFFFFNLFLFFALIIKIRNMLTFKLLIIRFQAWPVRGITVISDLERNGLFLALIPNTGLRRSHIHVLLQQGDRLVD